MGRRSNLRYTMKSESRVTVPLEVIGVGGQIRDATAHTTTVCLGKVMEAKSRVLLAQPTFNELPDETRLGDLTLTCGGLQATGEGFGQLDRQGDHEVGSYHRNAITAIPLMVTGRLGAHLRVAGGRATAPSGAA